MTASPVFDSICNFRDFGGAATRDGRRVRRGVLFRSGSMAHVSATDLERLGTLGIRTVCDLRRLDERTRHPNPDFGAAVVQLSWSEPRESSVLQRLPDPSAIDKAAAQRAMVELYRRMPDGLLSRLRGLFAALAGDPGAPLVLHCTVGKDRTGFAAALVLHALDVPREAILADYLLTNAVADLRERMLGADRSGLGIAPSTSPVLAMPREAQDAVLAADPMYLEAAFAQVDAKYGSVARYLAEAIGLTADDREKITRRLVAE